MNRASASDMIRNFSQMLKGEEYHRTLSELVTRFYFERICLEFGFECLKKAIQATMAHIEYYEALSSGGNRPGLRKLCKEFEAILPPLCQDPVYRFQAEVDAALMNSSEDRRSRLENTDPNSNRVVIRTFAFRRNPDVVAERLSQANGICDRCLSPAPFNRKSNGRPFLEVHHTIPLAEGGQDVVENTMALCPNCHREAHFGEDWA
ncbi:HNH endonuclease [Parasedimentitalea marina]|uniref:HNH endonuclease n=2 Tax=Parasedimentitalea marina TaxID=2483033 RepID=A0A3T0N8S4_9RHOB|nr:HNH endonuclease [Parasedimentitalea marina]